MIIDKDLVANLMLRLAVFLISGLLAFASAYMWIHASRDISYYIQERDKDDLITGIVESFASIFLLFSAIILFLYIPSIS